jgi:hypothetical protein
MPAIEKAKDRRDAALQAWRHELKLLKVCEPGSPQWEQQQIAVENAAAVYSSADDEYTEMLVQTDPPKHSAP